MIGLTRGQAAFLAVLIDADGAAVSFARLADAMGMSGADEAVLLYQFAWKLRRKGIGGIVSVPTYGYRLAVLPPDWALEDVLALLDELRREGFLRRDVYRWRRAS